MPKVKSIIEFYCEHFVNKRALSQRKRLFYLRYPLNEQNADEGKGRRPEKQLGQLVKQGHHVTRALLSAFFPHLFLIFCHDCRLKNTMQTENRQKHTRHAHKPINEIGRQVEIIVPDLRAEPQKVAEGDYADVAEIELA